ncbi:hypothetical protein [Ferruginibacter sp.]|nr:hypothetical protein [Ferruginibacter sp.]
MGRISFLIVSFLVCALKVFSQDLEGKWVGSFTDKSLNYGQTKHTINFNFYRLSDSSFEAWSKTFMEFDNHTDSTVCFLRGGFSHKNILYLEETKVIQPLSDKSTELCLQFMKLYYLKRKKQLILIGDWYTEENKCGYGSIELRKKL